MVVNKLDGALFLQQQALNLRASRQQLLAGNIANADTPNFQAKDFDFAAELRDALSGRSAGSLAMATTSPRHLPGNGTDGRVRLLYRQAIQPSVDGNTVNMDVERAQFAENAIQYEAGVSFLTQQIRSLLAAVQAS